MHAGIYCSGYDTQLNARNGFPVFSTHIEANYVSKSTDAWNVYKLTDEDRQKITAMAADPRIGEFDFCLIFDFEFDSNSGWCGCVYVGHSSRAALSKVLQPCLPRGTY